MKTLLRTVLSFAFLVLLAACAGTQQISRTPAPAASPVTATKTTDTDAYIARVEAIARRRGVQVLWVNRP
ncbi:MAG: hypothetical protein LH491_04835 [Pseudoxanthomonas sp.]|nr:hypothetical protein [Pseudoxanthomonas sp.]